MKIIIIIIMKKKICVERIGLLPHYMVKRKFLYCKARFVLQGKVCIAT